VAEGLNDAPNKCFECEVYLSARDYVCLEEELTDVEDVAADWN
jgi:hypothetical protein